NGAAAWLSSDATEFRLIQGAPNLASDPKVDTFATAGVVTETGYTLVGGGSTVGKIDRDPLVWTSDEGTHWQRVAVPFDDTYEELQRVAQVGDHLVAVGLHGDAFGAWRGRGDSWQAGGRFGATDSRGLAGIRSMTVVDGGVLVATQDGTRYSLW